MAKAAMSKMVDMFKMFKSPPFSIGVGTLVLTLVAIFLTEGGFSNMNPLYIIGLVFGIGLVVYGLIKAESKGKPENYDHNAYVAKMITDSKATQLLKLPDALKDLGQLDMELAFVQGRIKRPKELLQRILTRLRNDLEMERIPRELPDEAIWDAVVTAVKARNLTGISVNEDVRAFMVHVAGVLDTERMGIAGQRQNDKKYKLVRELQSYIATDRLNYAVRAYLSYSLGINSLLLLCDSCPAEDIASIMKIFGETDIELREERDAVLSSLLVLTRGLIERELKGDKNDAEALS
jgi:hypothetical protein